jgi:HAMP domain-containing protein
MMQPVAPSPRRSLRWTLLAIALLPPLLMGIVWLGVTTLGQARDNRESLILGAIQSAGVYSQNITDQMQGGQTNMKNAGFVSKLQARLSGLFSFRVMPLNFVAVTDANARIVAAYDARSLESSASVMDPMVAWKSFYPSAERDMSEFIREALRYQAPQSGQTNSLRPDAALTRKVRIGDQELTLVAYPMLSGIGATIMALDMNPIEARVTQSIVTAIIALLVTLIVAALVATWFASRLSSRLQLLASTADQISMGTLDQPVNAGANDEIGDLGQAIERLRSSVEILMSRQARRG